MTSLRNLQHRVQLAALVLTLMPIAGCHSHFVNAILVNQSGADVHLVEVDYPSASFGTEQLGKDQTFKYRFKILGDGQAKLSWTDDQHKDHTAEGPALHEGQEGSLTITLTPQNATWDANLRP